VGEEVVVLEPSRQIRAVAERAPAGVPAPYIEPRRNRDFVLRRLLVTADVTGIVIALALAVSLFGTGDPILSIFLGLVLLPAWILLFKIYGLYDRDAKRVSHSSVDDLPWLFHALVIGSLGLWVVFRYGPADKLIFTEGLVFFSAALGAIFLSRALARTLSRFLIPPERVLFVGGGQMAVLLARKFRLHPEYELEPIGYADIAEIAEDGALPYLGTPHEIESICSSYGVERVVILSPEVSHDELADLIRGLRWIDVRISILPHVVDVLGSSVEIDDVEGITVLGVSPPMLTRSSRMLKRSMDLVVASVLLVLTSWLFLLIALAIKLTSRGPVVHRQERIGRGERRFRIYKFRTMVADAEQQERNLLRASAHPAWLLLEHDPRVTRVGRFLRRTSLDELPQLLNVMSGDMSMVGPRPLIPADDEHISGWGRRRLDLTPGITGLWQVLGRTAIPFEEMVKLDYLYVTNWSLWQDIRLLVHTLPAVMRGRGAN
jgi:exopolysaccharide biosynthesis polyprenyl glycosylphosphotransferase